MTEEIREFYMGITMFAILGLFAFIVLWVSEGIKAALFAVGVVVVIVLAVLAAFIGSIWVWGLA